MSESLLEARGVRRTAGKARLLDNVSLTLEAAARGALVGPSGSGKTLLLRALALLDPLDAGEVLWQGKPVADAAIPAFRAHAIYLRQRPSLLEGTVEDNLRQPFSLAAHRLRSFDRPRVVALLESLGRGPAFLAKRQADLSGGEAQMTALLRAIQLDPQVLLLDEPTSALDAESTALVEALVEDWWNQDRQRRATLWVTHNAEQVGRVADWTRTIRDGRLAGEADGDLR